jgi:hypothetical protein
MNRPALKQTAKIVLIGAIVSTAFNLGLYYAPMLTAGLFLACGVAFLIKVIYEGELDRAERLDSLNNPRG